MFRISTVIAQKQNTKAACTASTSPEQRLAEGVNLDFGDKTNE